MLFIQRNIAKKIKKKHAKNRISKILRNLRKFTIIAN